MTNIFLFGGPYNGQTMEMSNDCGSYINLPKSYGQRLSYALSEPSNIFETVEMEIYHKAEMVFKRDAWNTPKASGYKQMEDLYIYIHSSVPVELIGSIEKIILMTIRAKWEAVYNGY